MKKLAIVVTHPIQYYAPLFQLLSSRQKINISVFYTWGDGSLEKHDPGFGKTVDWDIPLLDGYAFQWIKNTSADPGSHNFKGIINPGLIKQIKDWMPDAILVFGWAYHSHLKMMRHFYNKIPVWFRGDSTLIDEKPGFKNGLKFIFLRWVYRHVDVAFYTGINNKAYFKRFGLKEKKLTFAPHAVDNDRFAKTNEATVSSIKNNFGIKEDDITILFAGKFEDKKDPLLLLDCIKRLNKENCHLLFIGDGQLKKLIEEKSTGNNRIHFMEFQNQSNMPAVYHACDLFCLPSKGPNETWGLAVNEAMAAGKAILVSDKVGCAIDLVKDDVNGLIFTAGHTDSLTACLDKMTRSKSQLIQMGKSSQELIKSWNFTKLAEAIENKLLDEKK